MMKRPAWVEVSGPFQCVSLVNGHILVKPSWPRFGPLWNPEDGGGPGALSRLSFAANLEIWLNSGYSKEEIAEAKRRIAEHDENLRRADHVV